MTTRDRNWWLNNPPWTEEGCEQECYSFVAPANPKSTIYKELYQWLNETFGPGNHTPQDTRTPEWLQRYASKSHWGLHYSETEPAETVERKFNFETGDWGPDKHVSTGYKTELRLICQEQVAVMFKLKFMQASGSQQ